MRLLWLLLAFTSVAEAAHVESIGKVTLTRRYGTHLRQVGDARYLSTSELEYGDRDATVELVDLDTTAVIHVTVHTANLEHGLSVTHPEGELVSYTPERVAFHLADHMLARSHKQWYAEVDPKTGNLVRSIVLGTYDDDVDFFILGTDPTHKVMWFYEEHYAEHPGADAKHVHGPTHVALRRLDLDTLAITEVMSIALPARAMKTGYEDRIKVHHAADFSHFAIVEYDERAFDTKPTAHVYIVDPVARTTFAVPALDTTYGVAFSHDYVYLASSQLGTIARVDLAKQRIDKTVAGPLLTHDLVISPDGSKLIVIGTSTSYTELSLPSLAGRTAHPHETAIAPAMTQLFGNGMASLDGQYYVVPPPLHVERDGSVTEPPPALVIARVVD